MKVALLTTDTTHHLYFAWQLAERAQLDAIVIETAALMPPFETAHPFERRRGEYEREVLLAGCSATYADLAHTEVVASANEAEAALRALEVDVALVFGTGRLLPPIIRVATTACLNLHGGNPEEYRGLDTHLWAIYHGDFTNLVTTLHHVDEGLDTGDIVLQAPLPLERTTALHELRAINTKVCVGLCVNAVAALAAGRPLPARPQRSRGRYYSFMPAVLKGRCVESFQRHVATL